MQNIEMVGAEPQSVEQRINCLGLMMKYAVVLRAFGDCIRNYTMGILLLQFSVQLFASKAI